MTGVPGDGSTTPAQLTRRERRIARSRARRSAARVGWPSYTVGVLAVVAAATWLAVGGAATKAPEPAANIVQVQPVVVVPDPVTTSTLGSVTPVAPVEGTSAPTTSTTTTTPPVISAAATPAAPDPAP